MAGRVNWEANVSSNVREVLEYTDKLRGELEKLENGNYGIKLNIDEKRLASVISNLDKMLSSLGKGSGDFKQFENLSKELSGIISEVQNLSKAFGKVDDSGTKTLLSSIQNIDKSLSELSQHIINVNKNMGNIGGDTNGAVKQVENISNAYDNAAKSAEKLADAQSKIGNKSNISSENSIRSVLPSDSEFKNVIANLDLTKSKLSEIVKITRQAHADKDGKFYESFTLTDRYGSTETYGESSKTSKGQLLNYKYVEHNAKAVEQEAKAIERMNNELKSYNNQIPKKPVDGQRSDYFEGFVQNYKNAIKEAQKYLDNLGDSLVIEEVKNKWKELTEVIERAKEKMDAVPNADRGSDSLSRGKEIDTITKYLEKFTSISKQAKQELKGLVDQLQSGDPSVNVKKIHERFLELTVAEREAGREGKSFLDIFKNKIVYNYAAQLAGYYLSFMDIIRYARNAVSAIQELDTALVDLKKTTSMTASELEQFYYNSNDVAKEMGVTTASIIEQASAWSRLGYSGKEAATQMAELSSQFASISPGMSTDDAQEGLVSIMKAWDISTDQVEREVMDNINVLGNKFAETNQDIVEGMKRSAATFAALGQTWTDSFAIFTGAQEVIQNAETVGKSISAYLYSNIMKIKVAISVKIQRWTRPRKDYNICYNF